MIPSIWAYRSLSLIGDYDNLPTPFGEEPDIQACLRPRDRFWDIPVPKIDSAFDNLFVPQPSWSPSTTQQLRKLVAAPYLAPNDWTPRSEAYFVFPLAQGTPGKQCGLAATGVYQPSLRSPWLAAEVTDSGFSGAVGWCGKTVYRQGSVHQPVTLANRKRLGIAHPKLVGGFIAFRQVANVIVVHIEGLHVGQRVVGLGRYVCFTGHGNRRHCQRQTKQYLL